MIEILHDLVYQNVGIMAVAVRHSVYEIYTILPEFLETWVDFGIYWAMQEFYHRQQFRLQFAGFAPVQQEPTHAAEQLSGQGLGGPQMLSQRD